MKTNGAVKRSLRLSAKALCAVLAFVMTMVFLPFGGLRAAAKEDPGAYTLQYTLNGVTSDLPYGAVVNMLVGETIKISYTHEREMNHFSLNSEYTTSPRPGEHNAGDHSGYWEIDCGTSTGKFRYYFDLSYFSAPGQACDYEVFSSFYLHVVRPGMSISSQNYIYGGSPATVTVPVSYVLPRGAAYPDDLTLQSSNSFIDSVTYDPDSMSISFHVIGTGKAQYTASAVLGGTTYDCSFSFTSYCNATGAVFVPSTLVLSTDEQGEVVFRLDPEGALSDPDSRLNYCYQSGGHSCFGFQNNSSGNSGIYLITITPRTAGSGELTGGAVIKKTNDYGYFPVTETCQVVIVRYVDEIAATEMEHGKKAYYTDSEGDDGNKYLEKDISTKVTDEDELVMHNMQKVSGKAASCVETGIREHWKCTVCGKLFGDAEGSTEVTAVSVVIPKTDHSLSKTEAVPAKCETAGKQAYWLCTICGEKFGDAEGKKKIDEPETVAPLGHDWGEWTEKTAPAVDAEGVEQRVCKRDSAHVETRAIPAITYAYTSDGYTWRAGSGKTLNVTVKRSYKDEETRDLFDHIEIKGKTVPESAYGEPKSGSVIIDLKASYLEDLGAGRYKMKTYFTDGGVVTTKLTIKSSGSGDTPGTGDNIVRGIVWGAVLFVLSAGVIAFIILRRRSVRLTVAAESAGAVPAVSDDGDDDIRGEDVTSEEI